MAKSGRKHLNNAIYASPVEDDSFNTEKCLDGWIPTRKPKFIIICAFLTVFAFVTGLVIGYFTKNEVCGDNSAVVSQHREDFSELTTLLQLLDEEKLRRNLRYFSSEPHLSGSRRSKELADEIRSRWDSYGFHVDTVEYDVLLPKAKEGSPDYFEIKDNAGNVTMRHTFAAVGKSDPGSNKTWIIPRYLFYSPPGSVQGGLLYVNEGRKKDFDYLKKINITSCNGSVVLLKYSYFSKLEQLKNAYDCQASGILLFREDFASNETTDKVYPNGTDLPEEQPRVISLVKGWMFGDLLTPDLPASDGIYRLDEKDLDLPAKLPIQIVEFDVAKKLMDQLQGSQLPEKWKLNSEKGKDYRIGPLFRNNLTLHLTVNSKAERTKIYDVIGTVYGRDEPDDWVLVGNHRDAMTFGAVDAGSGTAGIMELSRGIGKLLKKGWKPRRTIKFCSWAAEEQGVIGSTEYVEDNKKVLQDRAVAYINIDMLVHGNGSLKAAGNPLMADLVYSQSKLVDDPHGSNETIYSVWKKGRPDHNGKDRPQFYTPPLGSDYIPFYEIAGVPSVDLQYAKVPYTLPQTYHTVYDTYHLVSMFDPHFQFHLAQTKLTARLVYELANSILIPFNLNSFTTLLQEIVNQTRFAYDKELKLHGINLATVTKATLALAKAGRKFEEIKNESNDKTKKQKVRQLNRRMITFNKIFISSESIPERFNMRNLVLGISRNYFYPNITLAGISDAIIDARTSGRWEIVKRQVSLTQHVITQARRSLEMP